ncbi:MAG: hypothetical protein V4447_00900 [Pseudomonadota bacterium]
MFVYQEHASFVKKTTLFVISGVVLSILFVVIVDPYRIYGLVDRTGFNHVKPAPERYQEQIKLVGAKRLNANVLILGNSRAEIGFDTDDKIFATAGNSSYNLAVPGKGIDTSRRQLEQLRGLNIHPKVIILGLDFLDFLTDKKIPYLPNLEEKKEKTVSSLKWQFDLLFSLQSVADGIKTLRIQNKTDAETITTSGFNPLLEYKKYSKEQGYYALFQQRAEENAKNYLRKSQFVIAPASDSDTRWGELRTIMAAASEENAELHMLIYPYHAQILLMFEEVGLMPAFEQWKAQLAQELERAKRIYPQTRSHLWDFSGYSTFQCDAIPAKNDKSTVTKWYWEAGHFKASLGKVILSKMFDKTAVDASDSFGYALKTSNISSNKQRLAEERQECLKQYPDLFLDVARLIREKQ